MRTLAEIEADLAVAADMDIATEYTDVLAAQFRLAGDVKSLLKHIKVQAAAQQRYRDTVRAQQNAPFDYELNA